MEPAPSRSTLWRQQRAGKLMQPVRGVYLPAAAAADLITRARAVAPTLRPGEVFAGTTALALHAGLQIGTPDLTVISPPGLRRHPRAGLQVVCAQLAAADVVSAHGLRVTAPARTAADLARRLDRANALAALDALTHLQLTTVAEIRRELNRARGGRGVCAARALTHLVDPRAESRPESILRLYLHDAGFTGMVAQLPLWRGLYRIDIAIGRVFLEYDSVYHLDSRAQTRDRMRQNAIMSIPGVRLLRLTAPDVFGEPRRMLAQVAHARELVAGWEADWIAQHGHPLPPLPA